MSSDQITVNIKCTPARIFSLKISASALVSVLKDRIAEKEGLEKGLQRVSAWTSSNFFELFERDGRTIWEWPLAIQVIYSGSELDDSTTLSESQVEDGSTLFLVQRTMKSVTVMVKTLKVSNVSEFFVALFRFDVVIAGQIFLRECWSFDQHSWAEAQGKTTDLKNHHSDASWLRSGDRFLSKTTLGKSLVKELFLRAKNFRTLKNFWTVVCAIRSLQFMWLCVHLLLVSLGVRKIRTWTNAQARRVVECDAQLDSLPVGSRWSLNLRMKGLPQTTTVIWEIWPGIVFFRWISITSGPNTLSLRSRIFLSWGGMERLCPSCPLYLRLCCLEICLLWQTARLPLRTWWQPQQEWEHTVPQKSSLQRKLMLCLRPREGPTT